jgi:hypothetical protein
MREQIEKMKRSPNDQFPSHANPELVISAKIIAAMTQSNETKQMTRKLLIRSRFRGENVSIRQAVKTPKK